MKDRSTPKPPGGTFVEIRKDGSPLYPDSRIEILSVPNEWFLPCSPGAALARYLRTLPGEVPSLFAGCCVLSLGNNGQNHLANRYKGWLESAPEFSTPDSQTEDAHRREALEILLAGFDPLIFVIE